MNTKLRRELPRFLISCMIFIGLIKLLIPLYQQWEYENASFADRLVILWEKDLLTQRKASPKFWSEIKTFRIIPGDPTAKLWALFVNHLKRPDK